MEIVFIQMTKMQSAIIGIDFNFFTVGNNMIAVSANGTSVVIEEIEN